MPQRKARQSGDPALSRMQLMTQGVDVNELARNTEASTQLGTRSIDMLADMAAKGKISIDQLKEILAARASLSEVVQPAKGR